MPKPETKKYNSYGGQKDFDNTPVSNLCRKTDLPHAIANLLISKTEKQTAENIETFMKWYNKIKGKNHD